MSKKRVYASIEIADQEIRLVVLEIFESRYNVLRVESVACSGAQNQTIVNEANVVSAIRTAVTNAQAALGYRIERVLLAIPSVNVMRSNQKVHVQIEDGTKSIRLFHIQQGYNKAIQKKLGDDVEFVNANRISYIVNGQETKKLPLSQTCEEFTMDIDLLYANKEMIYAYARCIEQANLEILDLCLDSYAIAQETAVLVQSNDRPIIQLDLEKDHCTMGFFTNGRLISCANLENGYNSFVEDITKKYRLSDEVGYRLLQNIFSGNEDENSDVIVYIEQKEDMRVEITAKELANVCLPKIRQWIANVNEACTPIVRQGNAKYVITGKGSNISVLKDMDKAFNAEALIYEEQSIGARDGSYVCGLGMAYAWQDINRIRHSDKISANNNELEASIDSINQQSKNGEGGFTKKLKSVILSEND
ncbi:hypothetical protein [Faecalitalea cylindroides]|uniref:hypothetical protein n=1 Tax=Faecalitalea cylindroides TaxID=39483 RepID=UPI0018995A17|nr:hypothetical protein [Faecalitalea cylindroides]